LACGLAKGEKGFRRRGRIPQSLAERKGKLNAKMCQYVLSKVCHHCCAILAVIKGAVASRIMSKEQKN
jgi:hypothetical protein